MLTPEIISLYLPHAVKFKCKEGIRTIRALYPNEKNPIICRDLIQNSWNFKDIKLRLKPVIYITPHDAVYCLVNLVGDHYRQMFYLASQHYDVLGLIESGDAESIYLEEEVKDDK